VAQSAYINRVANKEHNMQLCDCGYITVTVKNLDNDNTVSIADLAKFVEFNPADAARYKTSVPVIAYDALEDEYGPFEKVGGDADYYDGAWMEFKDGSMIFIDG